MEKLKAYKEIIAICVLFVSGFLWLESRFVRSDAHSELGDRMQQIETNLVGKVGEIEQIMATQASISVLHCLQQSHLNLLQTQITIQEIEKQIDELKSGLRDPQIAALGDSLSPAMLSEIQGQQDKLRRLEDELFEEIRDFKDIRNGLEGKKCGVFD